MPTELPFPISFTLPDRWHAAEPDEVGAPGAAFVALRENAEIPGFTTNITVDGEYRPDPATLEDIGDESIERLRTAAESVELARRDDVGSSASPGMTQLLRVSTVLEGAERVLVQHQVYLQVSNPDDPGKRAYVRLALTAPKEQYQDVVGEFQQFVRGVRLNVSDSPGQA